MEGIRIKLRHRKKVRIEIIPLIDVIFFLLATFVLFTLSLNRIQSVPVDLPVASSEPTQEKIDIKDMLTIQVSDQGNVYWNRELIDLDEVPARLEQYKKQVTLPRVLVAGDDRARDGPGARRGPQGQDRKGFDGNPHPADRTLIPTPPHFPIAAFISDPSLMRKDLIIGIVVSASLIAGLLLGFNGRPEKVKHGPAQTDDTIQIEMPVLPPEPPETKKAQEDLPPEDDAVQVTFAPPSLVDIPTIVPDATFVQQIAPPPPPGIEQAKGVVTIPPARPAGFGRGLGQIFDISQLDQIPVARIQQQPIYPYEMRRAGITGEVNVGFIVDSNGDVRDAYVINSTHREFEVPAVQAVSKWKFRPGRRGGRAVNTRMSVPIVFSFND
jgi:protein TonB